MSIIDERNILVNIYGDPGDYVQGTILDELGPMWQTDLYSLRLTCGNDALLLEMTPANVKNELVFKIDLRKQDIELLIRIKDKIRENKSRAMPTK